MTLTVTIIVRYSEIGSKYPRHTRVLVPIDDTKPIWTLKSTIDEAVREWGLVSGYTVYDWALGGAHLGRSDFFRGEFSPISS